MCVCWHLLRLTLRLTARRNVQSTPSHIENRCCGALVPSAADRVDLAETIVRSLRLWVLPSDVPRECRLYVPAPLFSSYRMADC